MRYITPEHCIRSRLGDRPAPSWSAALMVFRDHPHSRRLLDEFGDVRPVRQKLLYNLTSPEFEPFVFEGDVAGQTVVIVTRCVWGGPQTAILVEELACLGVPIILGYGVAGGLEPDLPQATLVVAEEAIPTDGTSLAYGADSSRAADAELVRTVKDIARQLGEDMRPVKATTVDALYRETAAVVQRLRAQGGQIVNLETSPLYAASAVCGVRAVWLGYVSDCLVDGKWKDWFADLGTAAARTSRICRNVLSQLLCG